MLFVHERVIPVPVLRHPVFLLLRDYMCFLWWLKEARREKNRLPLVPYDLVTRRALIAVGESVAPSSVQRSIGTGVGSVQLQRTLESGDTIRGCKGRRGTPPVASSRRLLTPAMPHGAKAFPPSCRRSRRTCSAR
jgi:hypothetical protein